MKPTPEHVAALNTRGWTWFHEWDHGPGAGFYVAGLGGFGVGYDSRPPSPNAPTLTKNGHGWVRTWRALGFSLTLAVAS